MQPLELLSNIEKLQKIVNLDELENELLKPELKNPVFYHIAVEKYTQLGNLEKAMYYASFSSDFIIDDNGKYSDSLLGNSIGTMMSFPLIKWRVNSSNRVTWFKVLASAYIYLTNGIMQSGLDVYDTIRTRGLLYHKYSRGFENLANEYYATYIDTKEITQAIIHDKILTFDALREVNLQEAKNALSTAEELISWYRNNFKVNDTVGYITSEGSDFHEGLYDSLINEFNNGEFNFLREEYIGLIKI
jgi:hypothetical protein